MESKPRHSIRLRCVRVCCVSRLMAEACKEARKGNKSLKESVRHIGNKILNAVEVSCSRSSLSYIAVKYVYEEKKM